MVRSLIVSVALALASADDEQASLIQTRTREQTHKSDEGIPSLKDTDFMALVDSLIAHPQSMAEELMGAEPSVQRALVQRANEKPRRLLLLQRVLDLPANARRELFNAAKTSPEVGRLFHSLGQQTHLNLLELARADSVEAVMESKAAKDSDWLDISEKNKPPTCSDYFGDVTGVVTVADPDIGVPGRTEGSGAYCDQSGAARPCTFIHYAGLSTECVNPAPPDACHRYRKVRYSKECESILSGLSLTGSLDTALVFERDGVLKQCKDHVLSNDMYCWGPPADNAQRCECEGDETTQAPEKTTTEAPEKTTTEAPDKTTTEAPEKTTTLAPEKTTTEAPEKTTTLAAEKTTTAEGGQ
jgi:hypothetical protein